MASDFDADPVPCLFALHDIKEPKPAKLFIEPGSHHDPGVLMYIDDEAMRCYLTLKDARELASQLLAAIRDLETDPDRFLYFPGED